MSAKQSAVLWHGKTVAELQALAQHFYPHATLSPAVLSESEANLNFNDQCGCQEIQGISVDFNGDGNPDIFLYEEAKITHPENPHSPSGDQINYAASFWRSIKLNPRSQFVRKEEIPNISSTCETKLPLPETPFPYPVKFPSDSNGRIKKVLMYRDPALEDIAHQLRHHGSGFSVEEIPPMESVTGVVDPWIQDKLLIGMNRFGVPIAIPDNFPYLYSELAKEMSAKGFLVLFGLPFFIEGGQVVASDNFLFTTSPSPESLQSDTYGRRVISIQANAHVDMILTPLEETKDGKPVVLVAQSVGITDRDLYANVVEQLKREGFYVDYVPYIPTQTSYYFSFNNVLIEKYEEDGKIVRRVYMPWYETIPYEFNERAAAVYQRHGYTVIPIKGLDKAASKHGSLRCLTKVLERE